MPDFTLHRVTADDDTAALFARIASEVFDHAVEPARLAAYLAGPGHLLVVALAGDGEMIGMAMAVIHLHPDKVDELYVDEIGVTAGWRRRGVAKALMAELFAWGKERGCGHVWVGTEPDNGPANALYASLGLPSYTAILYEADF